MPLGFECRERLIKQRHLQPTVPRGPISQETAAPGPMRYTVPPILGGSGYSRIKREPAYEFGRLTKEVAAKPARRANAPLFDVTGLGSKGPYRIPGTVMSPRIEGVKAKSKIPGPGTYTPKADIRYKCPPSYTMQPRPKPKYESGDQWTAPPNMYYPPILKGQTPKFTFGHVTKRTEKVNYPGPGQHDPNFDYVRRSRPAFSFGARIASPAEAQECVPPNKYCEKKFNVNKPTAPSPSFGIRHSPFLGKPTTHLKPSNIDLQIRENANL